MPESRHFCPHCEEIVSLSTIRRHKQLYYDESSHTWTKASDRDRVESDSDHSDADYEAIERPYESSIEGIMSIALVVPYFF